MIAMIMGTMIDAQEKSSQPDGTRLAYCKTCTNMHTEILVRKWHAVFATTRFPVCGFHAVLIWQFPLCFLVRISSKVGPGSGPGPGNVKLYFSVPVLL